MLLLYICAIIAPLLFHSCTTSIHLVHTQGTATDVIDEQQTPSTNVSPDISVSGLPGA
jgi:hypothetical protein